MIGRVLAFQPWDDGSHRAVRAAIERHGRLDWSFRCLPGRGPRWRLRHASLRFAEGIRGMSAEEWEGVAAIHATSMLDLAVLRAVLPRGRRDLGMVLSMHENQVAYPTASGTSARDRDRDGHLAFTNLASIEAADRVVWNSGWNRDSFIEGMAAILRHAPEPVDDRWVARLEARSVVVPPPIEMAEVRMAGTAGEAARAEAAEVLHNTAGGSYSGPPEARAGLVRVAWPHRWEHDKGPEELLGLADEAWEREQAGGPRIRWWLLGQRFNAVPDALKLMLERHSPRIEHAGPLPRRDYLEALHGCDWVLSTARHEFYGMAVVEALMAGCLPWLPERLSYPGLVPAESFGLNPWAVAESSNCPVDPGLNATIGRIRDGLRPTLAAADAPRAVADLEAVVESVAASMST